jgi:hypothetical protein
VKVEHKYLIHIGFKQGDPYTEKFTYENGEFTLDLLTSGEYYYRGVTSLPYTFADVLWYYKEYYSPVINASPEGFKLFKRSKTIENLLK